MTKTALEAIVHEVVDDTLLFSDERSPFRAALYDGDPNVCVIVGENASGKSLFFQIVAGMAHRQKITPVTISIRERTGAGTHEMGGMRRAFMFGDESQQSTGATSANVVASGFNNVRREEPAMLLLDEPELGLSDGYARALGQFIACEMAKEHENYRGLVIVTHSRALVDGLWSYHATRPLFVHLGDDPKPLERWLEEPEVRSIEDLLNLREVASARRKAVHQLLHNKDKT